MTALFAKRRQQSAYVFRHPTDGTAFSPSYKDCIKTASDMDAERSEDASRRFN